MISIGCLFTFCLLFGLLHLNVKLWTSSWLEKNAGVSLFLVDNISKTTYQNLYLILEQDFRIQGIREISSEETLTLLDQQMDIDKMMLSLIDETIFPITIDFEIRSEYYMQTASIIKQLKNLEGITDIVYPKQTLETLEHLLQGLNRFSLVLWFLGGISLFFTLFYLLHLSFQQHSQDLALLDLFGASFFSIHSPFLIETGIILSISALLSYGLTFLCYQISFYLISFQKISFFFNQTTTFYQWQDLLLLGFLTLLIGEGYSYWMVQRWYTQLRIQSSN